MAGGELGKELALYSNLILATMLSSTSLNCVVEPLYDTVDIDLSFPGHIMKMKRHVIEKKFAAQIEAMYM